MSFFDSTPYTRHPSPHPTLYQYCCPLLHWTKPPRGRYSAIMYIVFYNNPDLDRSNNHPTTVSAHLCQLDPWEVHLFPFFQATRPKHALKDFLENTNSPHLLIAHDSGASEQGSFS